MILRVQIIGLFIGIWFTFVNVAKVVHRESVGVLNIVLMAAAWTAFICATWLV